MSAVSRAVINRNNGKKGKNSEQKISSTSLVKCLNEKKRRESENSFFEQIAKLLPRHNPQDIVAASSVKPDKCAILNDAIDNIKNTLETTRGLNFLDLAQKILFPLVFDAFILVINSDGRVEYVSENVDSFLNFNREDVQGKSIYNIVHHGDHHRFSSYLLPPTLGSPPNPNRLFRIRLLLKPQDEQPQDPSQYEEMQIASLPVPFAQTPSSIEKSSPGPPTSPHCLGDGSCNEVQGNNQDHCVMCIASRLGDDESSVVSSFTTRLDHQGVVTELDITNVSENIASMLTKKTIEGRMLLDLCVTQKDVDALSSHLRQTLRTINQTETVFKIRPPGQSGSLLICTKSKNFGEFIMATHKILNDQTEPIPSPRADYSTYGGTPALNSPPRLLGNGSNLGDTSTFNGSFGYEMEDYDLSEASATNWEAPMSELAPQPVHLQG